MTFAAALLAIALVGQPADQANNGVAIQRNIEIFTGGLVLVGLLQAGVMFLQWRIYRRQANEMRRQRHEMRRQRHVMYRQWKAMRAQLEQMETASHQTEELIEQAKNSANAARDNAKAAISAAAAAEKNLDLVISRERPRISINEPDYLVFPSSGPCGVQFKLRFSGLLTAYILESAAIVGISDSRETLPTDTVLTPSITGLASEVTPTSTPAHGCSAFFLPNFVVPKTTIDEVVIGKKFVHFWGFIRFRDAFYDVSRVERKVKFHYIWKYTALPRVGAGPNDPPFGLWDGKYEEEEIKAD